MTEAKSMLSEGELFDLIAKEALVDRAKLVREATLDDLGVSSMDLMTMFFELEERYDVEIEGTDMPPMRTLGELSDFLLNLVNRRGGVA